MSGPERAPLRVVVCGTRFGQVYLSALRRRPERYRLVGIVARGGARSVALAEEYGVPLYSSVDQLPGDVDAACVVVSSGVGGGQGAVLARQLLARGVHVLQEHPVHPAELADCLRAARGTGTQYLLNTFYPHVEPVRRFVAAARRLVELRTPVFVDAMCAVQVSFDLLDILGEIFGGVRPWSLTPLAAAEGRPLTSVDATVAGVPLTLRVENRMEPGDDSTSLFLHRITVGTDAGNLTLTNTHGPVVWSPVPRTAPDTLGRFLPGPGASAEVLGPVEGPAWKAVLEEVWPDGVLHALDELAQRIADGADPLRGAQRHLTVAQAWQELTGALGFPQEAGPRPGSPVAAADLLRTSG
ncbi:Gfo/Idh/MocA family oxidoreductase [Streptomyces kronopolitis]|uniref:Gfo/Idh/MocA family oxidoreductase n=1 Tax=Streptomyces kronopolitis TaxID=1612435 RepID=UPI0020C05805|nr:Gfo/Idh/MocA family oxidoreductase [Streptomyces kronopolitis]MCL6296873.1 Gfo/Idh/MocA family oxidoreductase [Streptomyces kronopolitis]